MSTAYMIFNNEIDNCVTLTSSQAETNFPATYLRSGFKSKMYRSKPLTNYYSSTIEIRGTFLTSTTPVSGFAILNHNIMPGVTYTMSLYSDANCVNQIFSTGTLTVPDLMAVTGWGTFPWGSNEASHPMTPPVDWFGSIRAAYSFKIVFGNLTNMSKQTKPYLYIGNLVMGNFIAPSIGFTRGASVSYDETTELKRTVAGGLWTSAQRQPYKTMSLSFPVITSYDKTVVLNYSRYVGKRRSWYLSAYETEGGMKKAEYAMLCRFVKLPKFSEIAPDYYSMEFEVEEC